MRIVRHPIATARDIAARIDEILVGVQRTERRLATLGQLERQMAALKDALRVEAERSARDRELGLVERGRAVQERQRLECLISELRDSVHVAARVAAIPGGVVRVVFLVHHIESWNAYHDLVVAMLASDDFAPLVVSVPRRFPGSAKLADEDVIHRGLEERGIEHVRLPFAEPGAALRLIKSLAPAVIFRQSQWDADLPDELSADRLGFARLALVPYETLNIVENVPDAKSGADTAVDSTFHRAAWLMFCTNDLVLARAQKDGMWHGAQARVVGHPKAGHLLAATPEWPLGDRTGRRRVVWSTHHTLGQGWTNFGSFDLFCEEVLSWASGAQDTDFVWMPHPALLTFVDSPRSPITREYFDDWVQRWSALPNTAVHTVGDYAPILAAADVMVTDGLSMLVEPQVTGTPIVFVERPDHRPFNEIGEIVLRGVHRVQDLAEARRTVEKLRSGDPLAEAQRENVRELFGETSSVERILAVLRAEIAGERGLPA